jgi:polyhydroxybutyrate depolymerase
MMNTVVLARLFFFLTLTALFDAGCAARANPGDLRESFPVDGRERSYELHVPPTYDGSKAVPLVMALHGRLGTGQGQERLGHMNKSSDQHGFLIVYPDGIDRSWADGRGSSPSDKTNVNDVKFLSELIARLASRYKIDRSRVYATGMSNGGFMSARLACDLSEKLAAVAIVGASISTTAAAACRPTNSISVLIMQGTSDPLVSFDGGPLGKNGHRGEILSHDAAVQKFASLNHCPAEPAGSHIPDTAHDGTAIDVSIYSCCASGSEVRSYAIVNGGHTWPGGIQYLPQSIIGKTSHNLEASETIWEFFAQHSRWPAVALASDRPDAVKRPLTTQTMTHTSNFDSLMIVWT